MRKYNKNNPNIKLAFNFAEWCSLNGWKCRDYAQSHWDKNGSGEFKSTQDLFDIFLLEENLLFDKEIEIYKIGEDINTPLAEGENKIANSNIGDYVIIIDEEVWIRNWGDNENLFSKALYSPDFVRINQKIFKKQ